MRIPKGKDTVNTPAQNQVTYSLPSCIAIRNISKGIIHKTTKQKIPASTLAPPILIARKFILFVTFILDSIC